jgi:hypothetical protein
MATTSRCFSLGKHEMDESMKTSNFWKFFVTVIVAGFVLAAASGRCHGQELEARRWSHLPLGTNIAGGAYSYTSGEIAFDPVLRLDDVEVDIYAGAFKYVRSFELLGKSARVDFWQGYADAEWSGRLNGDPASTRRTGLTDSNVRFAMQLFGAPPMERKEFADYRAAMAPCETIVGVGLVMQLPTGHYEEDKLLNIGTNRFTIRPQLGVVHNRGKWSMELTGSAWIFTDNDDFFGNGELENEPLYALAGHVVYTFRPGLWLGGGAGYGWGAESTLNGVEKGDEKGNLVFGVSLGVPITPQWGIKFAYIGLRSQESVGIDSDTVAVGCAFLW